MSEHKLRCQFCLEGPFDRQQMLAHYDVCKFAPRGYPQKETSK